MVYGLIVLQSGTAHANELDHLIAMVIGLSILVHSSADILSEDSAGRIASVYRRFRLNADARGLNPHFVTGNTLKFDDAVRGTLRKKCIIYSTSLWERLSTTRA
ncbi:hypothetical protein CVV68_19825 [Arthrobacter livingstonensis]|uniref:Uncharacterized protein n=1 Tax=Arthrobacter livingstonensis TaxID=670078 RepID=A0A2V5L1W3_9MICC|nr:hypothetical protein [Arthrobacter livingstonensis]PYI65018.1 hypothetical protein CVV68_19825 [Arthrobacter livingstonensis]